MVIYKSSNKKEAISEEERKAQLLKELGNYSLSMLHLALGYAVRFEELGFDITERWETAERQAEVIQQIYERGYKDGYYAGIDKGREYEAAERDQMQEDEYHHYLEEEEFRG